MTNYEVRKEKGEQKTFRKGAKKVSSIEGTQADQIKIAKELSAHSEGREVKVYGKDGQVHQQDTVKPGKNKSGSSGKRNRSAITGKFVTAKTAKKNPKTTVTEKTKKKSKLIRNDYSKTKDQNGYMNWS